MPRNRSGVSRLTDPASPAARQQRSEGDPRLRALLDQAWEFELREDPLFATFVGDQRFADRLPSVGVADLTKRAEGRRALRERLLSIDPGGLAETDRDSHALLRVTLEDSIRAFDLGGYRFPITADSGFHVDLSLLAAPMPLETTGEYESYIARLRAFPEYISQNIELLREGIQTGWTHPRESLQGYEKTIEVHVVSDPTRSRFFAPFQSFPIGVPGSDRGRLADAGLTAIRDAVVPAYREFLEFLTQEYALNSRSTVGAAHMDGGEDYYEFLVRHFTTVDRTPDQVHELGLEEVRRIREEMGEAVGKTGFTGPFTDFLKFLRGDPRFYAKTPQDLLKHASWIAKRIDGRLPSFFGHLPVQPYSVEAVPAEIAPKYTAGRYVPAPPGGKKAGTFWVNTWALESRPLYVLESLTLHEAMPGHHLQLALSAERTDLPAFRRFLYVDAFGEGWGLYCERLGLEMGLYSDPYSNFGRLTYEMWRACRLVVDTGIHARGWSRRQAIEYLAAHTALSLHECTTETDRYISWPGQALAYKMGELKLRELRGRAEDALRSRFDVRQFHDTVLASGTMTLPILEARIDSYIRSTSEREA